MGDRLQSNALIAYNKVVLAFNGMRDVGHGCAVVVGHVLLLLVTSRSSYDLTMLVNHVCMYVLVDNQLVMPESVTDYGYLTITWPRSTMYACMCLLTNNNWSCQKV